MHAVFAAFHSGNNNAPVRSLAELRAQAFLRALICSVVALLDVHLYLFLSPSGTHATFTKHLLHPRIHLPPTLGSTVARVLQAQRYQVFLSLLRSPAGANISKLVVVDASDVVFQADPFPHIQHGLYTAEERPAYPLGDHAVNALWVRELFGDGGLHAIAHQRVMCSGVTMGTRAAMDAYLATMASEISARIGGPRVELLRASLEGLRRKHGRERTRGFDQGVHNVVVRGQLRGVATVMAAFDGLLWHGNEMRCGTDAVVVNGSLRIRAGAAVRRPRPSSSRSPAIVHQYGRLSGDCRQRTRLALTCRGTSDAQPPYCALCSRAWPYWLGDVTNRWKAAL